MLQIWNSIRTSELQREVQHLKDSFDQIKRRFGVEFDDLDIFENAVSYILNIKSIKNGLYVHFIFIYNL